MADNTVTLVLNGNVPIGEFSKAIVGFADLIAALSAESGAPSLEWVVDDLSVSSALATAKSPSSDQARIQAVISGYEDVGASLENQTEIKHTEQVRIAAQKIISINSQYVSTVNFDTAKRAAIIRLRQQEERQAPSIQVVGEHKPKTAEPKLVVVHSIGAAFGAVGGRIQTLTNRGGLRFTLYDLHYDKAVSCYFAEGKQEAILGLWGRLAIVEGFITRDPVSGRPLSIRQVENITAMREATSPFEYQDAQGVSPSLTGLSAEDAIRRIRDAE